MNSGIDRTGLPPFGSGVATATGHALAWLAVANGVGLVLATLLLWPGAGVALGGLTYGRWVPVHLNLQLYGWTSLPLMAWLFFVYQADDGRTARWSGAAVWAWSAAMVGGVVSWLGGHVSGKIFLDWKGGALAGFLVAQAILWLVLAFSLAGVRHRGGACGRRAAGLVLLACVPFALWRAANPAVYPPVDPGTGGPTGVSLLGSTLAVVWILLMVPRTLLERVPERPGRDPWLWAIWFFELVVFLLLEPLGGRHGDWWQIAALGLLVVWVPVVVWDWRCFAWPPESRVWRRWTLVWWSALVLSGWVAFLPGVLDRVKFSSALVAHTHLAMAGFTSSFCLLLLGNLAPAAREVVRRGGLTWNLAVVAQVVALTVAGWLEGSSQAWMTEVAAWRHGCFGLRWLCGVVMFGVSVTWLQAWWSQQRTAENNG